jgi:hypothetical protein
MSPPAILVALLDLLVVAGCRQQVWIATPRLLGAPEKETIAGLLSPANGVPRAVVEPLEGAETRDQVAENSSVVLLRQPHSPKGAPAVVVEQKDLEKPRRSVFRPATTDSQVLAQQMLILEDPY